MKRFMKHIAAGASAMVMAWITVAAPALADDQRLRPYVMAEVASGNMADKASEVKHQLADAGFEVVGEYSPYDTAHIIVVTNDALKANAGKSEFGGYGAAIRVAVTSVEGDLQVSYVNPPYMANAYRMDSELEDVAEQLASALGAVEAFGSEKGVKARKLRKYRYMFMMPSFEGHNLVGEHEGFEAATAAIEAALAEGRAGTSKVYRVDVPGKQEAIFGVAITEGDGSDAHVMERIDGGDRKYSAHLPYEVLVSGGKVYSLHGRFRIAQSFPDLTMGTFTKIMSAPGAIEDTMKAISQ